MVLLLPKHVSFYGNFVWQVEWDETEQAYICFEHWPKTTARQFFTVTNLILQYIVPCSIITYCYTKVSIVLKVRAKAKIGSGRNRCSKMYTGF